MMSKTVMASRVLCRSGLSSLIRRTGGHRGFVVLNYHRIGNGSVSEFDRGVYSARAATFENQLKFIRKECELITPDDIKDLPRRSRDTYVMITFDDGYRDNYELAFPILKSYNQKALFFIATGFVDRPKVAWWDDIAWMVRTSGAKKVGPTSMLPMCINFDRPQRQTAIESLLSVYKKLPPDATEAYLDEIASETDTGRCPKEMARDMWLTWDMVVKMRREGMLIGGHTVHHPVLSTLSRFEQELEIMGCARAIEQHLGEPMRYFSYPRGKPDAFNQDTRACLYEAQVQYAFSYYGGVNRPDWMDSYDIRRVAVDADTPIEHFEAMITLPRLFT
jgi:peptidoglycan/xylan/chitin deacetylase (PgdA/CDA1 family)